jgi:hypothetical protein
MIAIITLAFAPQAKLSPKLAAAHKAADAGLLTSTILCTTGINDINTSSVFKLL